MLTDKSGVEALRSHVLERLAGEIRAALDERPALRLILAHGSGSFGHVAAAQFGTRQGVHTDEEWQGFAGVSDAAARLNQLVRLALLAAGVPAITLQPSASARCEDGVLVEMATAPVKRALEQGLVPLLYGDVAFDSQRGGTIISTEEVLGYLADTFNPDWMLLAGEADGVLDKQGKVIPQITPASFEDIQDALRGSEGTDVTGGMRSKVRAMLALVEAHPGLSIRIFSGMEPQRLRQVLLEPGQDTGTVVGG